MSESKVYTLSDVRISESVKTKGEDERIKGFALTDKAKVSKSGKILVYRPSKSVSGLSAKIESRALDEDKLKALIEGIRNSKAKVFTFTYKGSDDKQKGYLTTTSKEEAIDILLSGLAEGYAQATSPSSHLKTISDVQTELSEGAGGAGEEVGGAGGAGEEGAGGAEEMKEEGVEGQTLSKIEQMREATRKSIEEQRRKLEEEKGAEDAPTPAEGGPAVAPPAPEEVGGAGMMEGAGASAPAGAMGAPPAPPGGAPMPAPGGAPAGGDLSEDQAKKALKQNPEADVNPALIGPDSAEEMKGLIYKDAFSLIFSDRSGIRELEQFKKSDENKGGERKAPDILYQEAEEIREGYKDQLKVVKLVFSVADEKKYLLQQWQEMHTLKKGAVQNITAGKSANPLNNYDSIGLVVDISSLGISLDDFLNFAERAGLSASGADGPSGGTTKLSGFRKPVDLSDVAPKKDDEEQDVKPMSEEQAEKDKKEKSEVVGAPEYITNRPVRGVMVKDGMRVKKHKEKRIKLYL